MMLMQDLGSEDRNDPIVRSLPLQLRRVRKLLLRLLDALEVGKINALFTTLSCHPISVQDVACHSNTTTAH